jgi:hypothetical protein
MISCITLLLSIQNKNKSQYYFNFYNNILENKKKILFDFN